MKNRHSRSRGNGLLKVIAVMFVVLAFPTLLILHSKWNMQKMTQAPAHSETQASAASDYDAYSSFEQTVITEAAAPIETLVPQEISQEHAMELPAAQSPVPVYDRYELVGLGLDLDTLESDFWDRQLDVAARRQHVLASFTYEPKYAALCKDYGITGETEYVDLIAVGDNLYHLSITNAGKQEDGSYNYDNIYANVRDYIKDMDIKIINQEVVITSDQSQWTNFPVFGAPIECGEAVVNAGFNVVTHATNHSWDKGRDIAQEDIDFWQSQNDLLLTGMYDSQEDYDNIVVGEYKGVKVAYLNYTQNLNGFTLPADSKYMVKLLNMDVVKADIEKAKQVADIVIVFPHWGEEYKTTPSWYQKDLAQKMADAGADLIIGTHPHVIQPLEIITSEDGREVPCFYSLGNFVSNMPWNETYVEAMAKVRIKKEGKKVSIEYAEAVPMVNFRSCNLTDYTVYMLEDYTAEIARTQRKPEITPTYVENFFNSVFTTRRYDFGKTTYGEE